MGYRSSVCCPNLCGSVYIASGDVLWKIYARIPVYRSDFTPVRFKPWSRSSTFITCEQNSFKRVPMCKLRSMVPLSPRPCRKRLVGTRISRVGNIPPEILEWWKLSQGKRRFVLADRRRWNLMVARQINPKSRPRHMKAHARVCSRWHPPCRVW